MLIAALAAAAAAASCDSPAPGAQEPSGPIRTAPANESQVNTAAPVEPAEAGALPAPSEGLRFVGRWAADQKSCESAAWQLTQTTLQTPAGSSCSFSRVNQVPGGYEIRATCSAEGAPTSDTLQIRFDEGANAMLFNSQTIADTRLVFCGREV